MKTLTTTPSSASSRSKTGHVSFLPTHAVLPSPENDKLYHPSQPDDPAIIQLAESIKKHGVLEPLVVTADKWIISGHRRHAAAVLAGIQTIPCRVGRLNRNEDPDGFLVALREHNRQREKSFDEKVREAVVSSNPDEAYRCLLSERQTRSRTKVSGMELRVGKKRSRITAAKKPMLDAVAHLLENFVEFLPVTVRFIHYHLLNDPPLVHASKPGSTYRNNKDCYKNLVDLIARARLTGDIPFESIDDETRPVTQTSCWRNSAEFFQSELNNFMRGYQRDLMQSQPNHIELLVEKNTAANILKTVALNYCIPMTSGRGFCSLPPRYNIAERFRKSGKEKLVLIMFSDFDPDGDEIAHSFARSLRDDFLIENIVPFKASLISDQVKNLSLPSSSAVEAKEKSVNYKRFVQKYGADQTCFELESMTPDQIQSIADEAIRRVIDCELFNREVEQEKLDAVELGAARKAVRETLKDFRLGGRA